MVKTQDVHDLVIVHTFFFLHSPSFWRALCLRSLQTLPIKTKSCSILPESLSTLLFGIYYRSRDFEKKRKKPSTRWNIITCSFYYTREIPTHTNLYCSHDKEDFVLYYCLLEHILNVIFLDLNIGNSLVQNWVFIWHCCCITITTVFTILILMKILKCSQFQEIIYLFYFHKGFYVIINILNQIFFSKPNRFVVPLIYQKRNMLVYYIRNINKLEKVDLVITDTPAFQILNEAMKGMKHVMIYLTTYSFHSHQQFTNSCNWQCSKLFIACQINLNQITCNLFPFFFPYLH